MWQKSENKPFPSDCLWLCFRNAAAPAFLFVLRELHQEKSSCCSREAAQATFCIQMTGVYCGSFKWYLCERRESKTILRGHPVAPAPALDYVVFVCVNVRCLGSLMASQCGGGGVWWMFTHRWRLRSVYPAVWCFWSDAHRLNLFK